MQYCRRWRWQPLALGDPIFSIMTALVVTMTLSAHATQTPPLADLRRDCRFRHDIPPLRVLRPAAAGADTLIAGGTFLAPELCGAGGTGSDLDYQEERFLAFASLLSTVGGTTEVRSACSTVFAEAFQFVYVNRDTAAIQEFAAAGFAGPNASMCACFTGSNDTVKQAAVDLLRPLECEHAGIWLSPPLPRRRRPPRHLPSTHPRSTHTPRTPLRLPDTATPIADRLKITLINCTLVFHASFQATLTAATASLRCLPRAPACSAGSSRGIR